MAQGKKIGEFSLKSASSTFTPGPGNTIAVQVNYEGSVTGEMAGPHKGRFFIQTTSIAGLRPARIG